MRQTRFISIWIVLTILLSISPKVAEAHGNSGTPTPPPIPKIAQLSGEAFKNAMVIDEIKYRPVLVPPGSKQLYRIRGTDIFVEISAEELIEVTSVSKTLASSATYTQICGINIYSRGGYMLVAALRNRANVTYYTGYTLAPARFNWMDMSGTRSYSLFTKWKSLGQYSYPSVRQRFETYGYTQAYGTLETNYYPFGAETRYVVSRLVVNKSGTFCR